MIALFHQYVTWTNFLTLWGAAWAVASVTQNAAKPGTAYWKACHVVLSISPLDFVKAVRTLGSSLVPPVACLALFLLLGCSGQTQTSGTANASLFSAQLSACGLNATTKAEDDACRASTERFWCGDGGALSGYSGCDAGAPKDGGGQ